MCIDDAWEEDDMEVNTMPKNLRELLQDLDAQGIPKELRYDHVRRFLDFRAREQGIPLTGTFELTPLCNLDCKMCYVHLNKGQMQGAKLLSTDEWKQIMKEAVDAGMMYAKLTGGECLTYPGFKELYLYLQSMGVEITVLTNGRLMDDSMVSFFKENPPAVIQITLYGADEEVYERVTGHAAFVEVVSNIRNAQDAGLPLRIALTPNHYLGKDGEALVRFVHNLNLTYAINSGLFEAREETGRVLDEYDLNLDDIMRMYHVRRELKGTLELPECNEETLPEIGTEITEEVQYGVQCGAGRSGFSIDWKGKIYPCNVLRLGGINVLETEFTQAWRTIHSLVMEYPLPVECQGCAYKKVCKSCVAEHANGANPGHANPIICQYGKRMVVEGLLKLE